MSSNAFMPEVDYRLVAKDLDLPIQPSYFTWSDVVHNLNSIKLPKNHIRNNACSSKINCRYPPGRLNTGVPRVLMPEVNRDVLENLKGKIPFTTHKITVRELANSYVAQREILLPKIEGQAKSHKAGGFNLLENTWYVATASDGKKVIIDGHHGWGAINLLLKESPPAIDPDAEVTIVDFSDTPEHVIMMAFYEGDAHSNPFRPELVKKSGGRRKQTRGRRPLRRRTYRRRH